MYPAFRKSNAFKILWQLISPMLIYYAGYYIGLFLIIMTLSANGITSTPDYANALVGGICMLCGTLALLGEIRQERHFVLNGKTNSKLVQFSCIFATLSLIVILNFLFQITGMTDVSEKYKAVSESQFAVPVWMGILLYGIISPFAEEMLFRFVIFRKLSRISGRYLYGILVSSFLFGIYHGNLVQGIYSFMIGIFLVYATYRCGTVWVAVFCHGIGNIIVFLCGMDMTCYQLVFHPLTIGVIIAIFAGTVGYLIYDGKHALKA